MVVIQYFLLQSEFIYLFICFQLLLQMLQTAAANKKEYKYLLRAINDEKIPFCSLMFIMYMNGDQIFQQSIFICHIYLHNVI